MRDFKHKAVVKGQTVYAETEEELRQKLKDIARSSNGKKPDSDSEN